MIYETSMVQLRSIIVLLLSGYVSTNVWFLKRILSAGHGEDDRIPGSALSSSTHPSVKNSIVRHSSFRSQQSPTYYVQSFSNSVHSPTQFGEVLIQFSKRVLSRHITSSNVLVVSKDADVVVAFLRNITKVDTDVSMLQTLSKSHVSVGGRFLQEAASEGHSIHGISSTSNQFSSLDNWWLSIDDKDKPSWILLAVIDCPLWREDDIWNHSELFLTETTVTYMVLTLHAYKRYDGSYRFGGLVAAKQLLTRRYKLQTLSISHYHTGAENHQQVYEQYGPNALFQSVDSVMSFLQWGADAAQYYSSKRMNPTLPRSKDRNENGVFTAFIFATQGLDLAIPSPSYYLINGTACSFNPWKLQHAQDISSSLKGCPMALDENVWNLWFDEDTLVLEENKNGLTRQSLVFHNSDENHYDDNTVVWMDGVNAAASEAACVKDRKTGKSKCTTRILETQLGNAKTTSYGERPNVLLILLDPISRAHFERTMPRTNEVLQKLEFVSFSNYTAVGPNSGPNQAALYSGIPLKSRNGISRNLNGGIWLWDRLRSSGYVTLKGEDGCIANSNMIQSLSPNTTHGSALQGLFCFDSFARPNCIGPDTASALLLSYGEQFITTYEHRRKNHDRTIRWASFLHFTDSHEDTMMLAGIMDRPLSRFLTRLDNQQHLENTVVIVCSDHGLHYGPHFPTKQGRKEATEPILHIRIPESLRLKFDTYALMHNANHYTTPFDLHETLLLLTDTSFDDVDVSMRSGHTLTRILPDKRKICTSCELIPQDYCEIQRSTDAMSEKPRIESTPKLESFFWDIPSWNRPKLSLDPDCQSTGLDQSERFLFSLCGS